MSSQPPSNENLSAYFDHEASAEERQELESLLETSPEARQELYEIGELSRLLQETATESAPPELAASIRRRIEQETLLPEKPPASIKRVPSLLRYRIAVAISTCSSLAALILFVLLMNTQKEIVQFQVNSDAGYSFQPVAAQPNSESIRVGRENVSDTNTIAKLSVSERPEMLGAKGMPAPSIAITPGKSGHADKTNTNEEVVAANQPRAELSRGDFSVMNSFAEKKLSENYPRSAMAIQPKSAGIPSHIPLDSIRIGDALPYFSNIDGKVAVIEVHVVDVKQALGTMELLLARNNIPVNQKKQSGLERQLNHPRNLKAKKKIGDNTSTSLESEESENNQIFAVYVEATDTQLASALQDFQKDLKRDQLVGLSLQPAIKASTLTHELETLPQLLAGRSVHSDKKNESTTRAAATLRSLGQKSATHLSKDNVELKKADLSGSLTKKREVSKGRKSSYQMRYRMQLPAEQLNRTSQRATLAQKNGVKQKAGKAISASPVPALVASKPGDEFRNKAPAMKAALKQISAAPVKVLFVFKDAATPTTSPAPQ